MDERVSIKKEPRDEDVSPRDSDNISRNIISHEQPQPSSSDINNCSSQSNYCNSSISSNNIKEETKEDVKLAANLLKKNTECIVVNLDNDEDNDESDETTDDDSSESNDDDGNDGNDDNGEMEAATEDDDQYDDCEEEDIKPNNATNKSGYLSSDEESEKCVICLSRFLGQTIGTPEVCNHNFCLECIEEWSKQVSACPVDRKIYSTILARREIDGQVIQRINVSADNQIRPAYDDVAPDDVTYCEVCGRCDREDRLLLCDGCDFGFHLECLNPPLEHVPIEDWYCPDCDRVNVNTTYQNTNLLNVIAHGISSEYSLIQRYRRRRMNPQGISEVVRTRINERRRTRGNDDLLTSSMSNSTSSRVVYSAYSDRTPITAPSTSNRIKQTKSKKKQSTKRKSTKRKTTKRKGKTTRRKGTRRIRRKKRKVLKRATVNLDSDSIRDRIARKLGMSNLRKTPFGLPVYKKAQNQSSCLVKSKNDLTTQRESAGIAQISLCGSEQTHNQPVSDPELYFNEHNQNDEVEYDNYVGGGAAAIAAMTRRRMTPACAARILAKKASSLRAPVSNRLTPNNVLNQRGGLTNNQCSNFDLLGSILSSQTVLLSKSDQSYGSKGGDLHRPSSEQRSALNSNSLVNLVRTHNDNQQVEHTEKTNSTVSVSDPPRQSASNPGTTTNNDQATPANNNGTTPSLSTVGISSTLHHQVCSVSMDDKSRTPTPEDFVIRKPSPEKIIKHVESDDELALDLTNRTGPIDVSQDDGKSDVYSDVEPNNNSDESEDEIQPNTFDQSNSEETKSKLSDSNDLNTEEDVTNLTTSKDSSNQSETDNTEKDEEKLVNKTSERCDQISADSILETKIVALDVQKARSESNERVVVQPSGQTLNMNHDKTVSMGPTNGNAIKESSRNTIEPTSVKVKRCKHGRIIVFNKDKSKKKDVVALDSSGIISNEYQSDEHEDSKLNHNELSLRAQDSIEGINSHGKKSERNCISKKITNHCQNAGSNPHEAKEIVEDEHKSKSKKEKKKKHHRSSCSRGRDKDRFASKSRSRSRNRSRGRSRSDARKSHHRDKSRSRSPRSSRKHRHRSPTNSRTRHKEREGDRKSRKEPNYRGVLNIEYSDNEEYYDKHRKSKKSPAFIEESNRNPEHRREEGDYNYPRGTNMPSTSHRYSPFDESSRRPYRESKSSRNKSMDEKNDRFDIDPNSEKTQPHVHKKVQKNSSLAQDNLATQLPSHKSQEDSLADLNDSSRRNISGLPIHSKTKESNSTEALHDRPDPDIKNQKNLDRNKIILIEPFTIGKRRILEPFDPSAAGQSSAKKMYADLVDEYENAPAKPVNLDYLSRFLPKLGETSTSINSPRIKLASVSEEIFTPPIETGSSKNNSIPLSPNDEQPRRAESVHSLPTPIQDEVNSVDVQRKYCSPETLERKMNRHEMSPSGSSMRSNSDIYDPEAPLGPISPSDSPTMSPFAHDTAKLSSNLVSVETANLVEQLRKMQERIQTGDDAGNKSMFDTMTNLINSLSGTNPNLLSTINKLTSDVMASEECSSNKGANAILNKICGHLSSQLTSTQRVGIARPQSPSTPPREKMSRSDDGVPSSAVDLNNQEKYIQKLNRQERVIEEVKLALKPHYQKRAVTKEEYKDILRRAVPKICHSKNGEINAVKIRNMVEIYIKKAKHARKRH